LKAFKKHLKESLKGEVNIDELSDDELQALAIAYIMDADKNEGEYDDEEQKADSDVDDIDFNNFKGIYFNDDPNRKY
jgi:cytochrome c553